MAFAGDLKKLPLGDVFQSIHQNGMTGALAVRDAQGGERLVAFEDGYVTGCSEQAGDERDIADELVRQNVISEKDVTSAKSRFFKRKGKLKRSLTRRRILESGEFDVFARGLVLERVHDCFLIEEGTFEFLEEYDKTRFSVDEGQAKVRVSASEILMEAMRRVDEWQRIKRTIPSFNEVYAAARPTREDDDNLTRELLSLTEQGVRTLEEVLQQVPVARFLACERVLVMVENGSLRVATGPEYLELGKGAEARGEYEAAANYFARGLHYERGNSELNERRIAVLEHLDRNDEAAAERKVFAGTLLEQGKGDQAERQFQEAARLAPADPLPRERLLDLQLKRGAGDLDPARETAHELVALYLRLGLGAKAKGVYPRLLSLVSKDRVLRERQAAIHEELNEPKVAARLRRELATEALKRKDPDEAMAQLRKVVELVPGDNKAKSLLEEVESGQYAVTRRRRRWLVLVSLMVLVGMIGLSWGAYEALAMADLRRAQRDAFPRLSTGCAGVLAALETIDLSRAAYPRTQAAEWGGENVILLSELYVASALRTKAQTHLRSPAETIPGTAVSVALTEALDPKGRPSLKDELARACQLLDHGQTAEARQILAALHPRLDRALEALQRADDTTRETDHYEIDQVRVAKELPLFWLAWGEVHFLLPEARERLQRARRELSPKKPKPNPEASPSPTSGPGPSATPG
jgi:tetratricopeptide (TPR) repeat protein